jgi:hypothetical protein
MNKNWVAVLSALLVAGACYAGGAPVKDKDAPSTFATVGCCTAAPSCASPCPAPCGGQTCGGHCNQGHSCAGKCKDWLCFVPLRTCPCECKGCGCGYFPLYTYFLRPCVERPQCWHADNRCASCVHTSCASSCGGCGRLSHPTCGCASGCEASK